MQGSQLTGSTGFAFQIGDESGSAAGARLAIPVFDCGFPEPSLISLLPEREVPGGICDIP